MPLGARKTNNSKQIVRSGLVLHLDAARPASYPGSGTTWTDLSGQGNNGTLTNGPTYSSANGGSIVFDGSDDYVTLGTPPQLNQVQVPLTMCAWAKIYYVKDPPSRTIWGVYADTSGGAIYSLLRIDGDEMLKYYASSGGGFQVQGSFVPTTDDWNFYAVTVSGSLSSPTVTIYLNDSSQTFSYSSFYSSPSSTVDFRIGGNQAQPTSEGWYGEISSVLWYNRALSRAEIKQNYEATKARHPDF